MEHKILMSQKSWGCVAYDGTDSACGARETKFILQAVLYTSLLGRSFPGNFLSRYGSYLYEVLYSTSVQSVAVSHTRSADEVADHMSSMRWLTVQNCCFLTPYHVLSSFYCPVLFLQDSKKKSCLLQHFSLLFITATCFCSVPLQVVFV